MNSIDRIVFSTVGSVLLAASAVSQASWTRQSPLPYAPQLNADEIAFSGTRGFIVGSSPLLHETTDGGVTWHERVLTGAMFNEGRYDGVAFSGPVNGWIVGQKVSWSNACFRTIDGGATWTQMASLPDGDWRHVDFVTPTRGWVGAWGALYKTSDAGVTWSPQSFGVVDRIDALNFFDSNVGVLSAAGALRRTQDGGQTWTIVHGHEAFAIEWLDASTVIASTQSSGGPDFARSTDAGLTWQTIQVPNVDLQEPLRVDATTVIAGTLTGDLYRSTDAGSNWHAVWTAGAGGSVNGGVFTSSTDGFVVASGNLILRTNTGGQTWSYASNGFGMEFEDVRMFDSQRGLVAGGGGTILRTDNGGRTWTPTRPGWTSSNGDYLKDLSLVPPAFAFAAGNHGTLVKTLDGGITWQGVSAPTGYPNGGTGDYWACSFVSPTEGWIAGSYLEITHTTDGGATWHQQFVGGSSADGVYDMDFVDAQHGFVVGTFGSGVLRTVNGGASWSFHAFPTPSPDGRAIDFVTPLVGWASSSGGWVARSTDGGVSWTRQTIPGADFGTNLFSIQAVSVNECWVASQTDGRVFRTTNAGTLWSELVTPFHDDYDAYTGLAVTANGNVWVAGSRGVVSHFGPPDSGAESICSGDGSGSPCPCGNPSTLGAGQGCSNSRGIGAVLAASGQASISGDSLVLETSSLPPHTPGLYVQGSIPIAGGSPFGSGLLCLNGATPRIQIRFADALGASATTVPVHLLGNAAVGDVRYYQHWYRDDPSFCAIAGFNLSNALRLTWLP